MLFKALPAAGFEILASGRSDWILRPLPGSGYTGDEAYFLQHILRFFEGSCAGVSGLAEWLAERRGQVQAGELVFFAHQVDFLVKRR
jgi:hypothetical protein